MKNVLPLELFYLARTIDSPIYVVGGAVRNFLMGMSLDSTDIDICGSFDISQLTNNNSFRISSINKKLGTSQIKIGDAIFEYTRFREEKYTGGKHTPQKIVFHDSIELDAKRRDFTCNSIYYDIRNDAFIDIFGGISDIKNKQIRNTTENTFDCDGLRIMRAVRFASQLNFDIESKTSKILTQKAALLKDISGDRVRDELEKILHADSKYGVLDAHYRGLKLLSNHNIFSYILPEIELLRGVKQNPKYHMFDVMEHTFLTVRYARDDIRLAALLHDTGKPACLDSEGHMKGHNVISQQIACDVLGKGRLNYSKKILNETARLCYLHMYDLKGETSDSKMKVFVAENFDIIDKIAALREADGKATGMPNLHKFNRFLYFKNLLEEQNAPLSIKDLKISGEIFERINISCEKRSELLKQLLHSCIIEPKLNNTRWLEEQVYNYSLKK